MAMKEPESRKQKWEREFDEIVQRETARWRIRKITTPKNSQANWNGWIKQMSRRQFITATIAASFLVGIGASEALRNKVTGKERRNILNDLQYGAHLVRNLYSENLDTYVVTDEPQLKKITLTTRWVDFIEPSAKDSSGKLKYARIPTNGQIPVFREPKFDSEVSYIPIEAFSVNFVSPVCGDLYSEIKQYGFQEKYNQGILVKLAGKIYKVGLWNELISEKRVPIRPNGTPIELGEKPFYIVNGMAILR